MTTLAVAAVLVTGVSVAVAAELPILGDSETAPCAVDAPDPPPPFLPPPYLPPAIEPQVGVNDLVSCADPVQPTINPTLVSAMRAFTGGETKINAGTLRTEWFVSTTRQVIINVYYTPAEAADLLKTLPLQYELYFAVNPPVYQKMPILITIDAQTFKQNGAWVATHETNVQGGFPKDTILQLYLTDEQEGKYKRAGKDRTITIDKPGKVGGEEKVK